MKYCSFHMPHRDTWLWMYSMNPLLWFYCHSKTSSCRTLLSVDNFYHREDEDTFEWSRPIHWTWNLEFCPLKMSLILSMRKKWKLFKQLWFLQVTRGIFLPWQLNLFLFPFSSFPFSSLLLFPFLSFLPHALNSLHHLHSTHNNLFPRLWN